MYPKRQFHIIIYLIAFKCVFRKKFLDCQMNSLVLVLIA